MRTSRVYTWRWWSAKICNWKRNYQSHISVPITCFHAKQHRFVLPYLLTQGPVFSELRFSYACGMSPWTLPRSLISNSLHSRLHIPIQILIPIACPVVVVFRGGTYAQQRAPWRSQIEVDCVQRDPETAFQCLHGLQSQSEKEVRKHNNWDKVAKEREKKAKKKKAKDKKFQASKRKVNVRCFGLNYRLCFRRWIGIWILIVSC